MPHHSSRQPGRQTQGTITMPSLPGPCSGCREHITAAFWTGVIAPLTPCNRGFPNPGNARRDSQRAQRYHPRDNQTDGPRPQTVGLKPPTQHIRSTSHDSESRRHQLQPWGVDLAPRRSGPPELVLPRRFRCCFGPVRDEMTGVWGTGNRK